jgi:N-acetylmuramoyl-L-alanine amidase
MKKQDNKLYTIKPRAFERKLRYLVVTALLADITAALMLVASIIILIVTLIFSRGEKPKTVEPSKEEVKIEEVLPDEVPQLEITSTVDEDEPEIYIPATTEEIELLALVTMAEAEGESVEGKRLVIDTVLNRVDSPRWPNTISEVIYQPSQFVAMSNGRAERCVITDEVRQLVVEELLSRTNNEVVYFTAGGYGRYGTPLFQVGNHYFCKL